ncbi:MAG: DUF711 family protein, partial [Anaerolineales bacterium]|nr:DUF711 family protein [Anaerolineales bacterium]
MDIRSITIFTHPHHPPQNLAAAAGQARKIFKHPIQTIRLAAPPFPAWLASPDQIDGVVDYCRKTNIDYLSIGPVLLDHSPDYLDWIPSILSQHEMVFSSAEIANADGKIDSERIDRVASLIRRLSTVRPDGFANLYFTAAAKCKPDTPFFPVSYDGGGKAHFAIAVESACLAVQAFKNANSLQQARANLVSAIELEASLLVDAAAKFADQYGLNFTGVDFSLAPFPEIEKSLGAAMEALGLPAVGGHGSLFAAAFLAECIDRARFPRCGFSGLMFPVLEDSVLAQRAADGCLALNDLLLYSAVCGAGLDTVPLAGDISVETLSAILLDLAALAV